MFFSTYVLTKKGPLAKIWLAAHWDKKLTSKDIKVVDLNDTIVQIVQPAVPIALRTSGELMLGVVRIYALKVQHLLKEATDATTILLRPKNIQIVKGSKDSTVNVTMDLVVGRVGQDQLAEADFGDIEDILGGGKGGKGAADDAVVGSAWFETEASQFQEAVHTLDDEELGRLRADLFAGPRGDSGSTAKKSSLSSVEAGRAASDPAADLLDLGVLPADELPPLPMLGDDLLADVPPLDDPFALPDMRAPSMDAPAAADEPARATARKVKAVIMFDEGETMLSAAMLKKFVADRKDIVHTERRHGPVDEAEAEDRTLLRRADTAVVDCLPLTAHIANAELRKVYQAALRASCAKTVDAMEAARGSKGDARHSKDGRSLFVGDDAAAFDENQHAPADFEYLADEVPEMLPLPDAKSPGRKRGRDSDAPTGGAKGFSASTLATLEVLRGMLKGKAGAVKFSQLTAGKKRNDAARMFVDALVLASHCFVTVSQAAAYGEITITATDKLFAQ
jgi:cohesin complex subunit SCC1